MLLHYKHLYNKFPNHIWIIHEDGIKHIMFQKQLSAEFDCFSKSFERVFACLTFDNTIGATYHKSRLI